MATRAAMENVPGRAMRPRADFAAKEALRRAARRKQWATLNRNSFILPGSARAKLRIPLDRSTTSCFERSIPCCNPWAARMRNRSLLQLTSSQSRLERMRSAWLRPRAVLASRRDCGEDNGSKLACDPIRNPIGPAGAGSSTLDAACPGCGSRAGWKDFRRWIRQCHRPPGWLGRSIRSLCSNDDANERPAFQGLLARQARAFHRSKVRRYPNCPRGRKWEGRKRADEMTWSGRLMVKFMGATPGLAPVFL